MGSSRLTESLQETVGVFETVGEPMTTSEVTERLPISRRSTYERLRRLADRDRVRTKKVGAKGRIWWRPATDADAATPDRPASVESLVDDVIDGVDVGIFVLDENFEVAWCNATIERYFGIDSERAVGRDKRTLIEERIAPAVADADDFVETVLGTYDDNTDTERFACRVAAGGEERWLEHWSKPIETGAYAGGRVELYYDVTDRREYERRFREETAFVESVLDNQRDIVYAVDTNGTFVRWNDRLREVTGYTDEELDGTHALEFVADEAVERAATAIQRVLESGESETIELPVVTADGTEVPYEFSGTPITDEDGTVIGLTGVGRDISERKAKERQLERRRDELEGELTAVFERIDDGFFALDEEWRFTHVNEQAATVLDRSAGELLGRKIWEEFPQTVGTVFQEEYERAVETQESVSFEGFSETFETWFEVQAYPSETGLSVYFRDITERKRFEEAIRTLHETSRELFHAESNAEVGRQVVTAASDVLGLSDCALYLYDEERGDLYPAAKATDVDVMWDDLPRVPPDDDTIVGHVYAAGESVRWDDIRESPHFIEAETGMRSGVYAPVGDAGVVFAGSDEVGAFDDRTLQLLELLAANAETAFDRVERERKLAESERRYRTLVENFPNGAVTLIDRDLRYVTVGGNFPEGIDVTMAELEGRHVRESLPPELVDLFVEHYEAAFDGESSVFEQEFGGRIYQFRIVPVYDSDGTVFAAMGMSQDVTDRKERERELERQREQLAALNSLNRVVRDITDAVIAQSTRDEIEAIVCERLAETDSYLFAWIGDIDVASETVTLRAEAGVEGYLDGVTISIDPDDQRSVGPTGRAFRTGEVQVTGDAHDDSRHDPWRDHVEAHGFRSSAAIPIVHEGTTYGVLNVYAERPHAFEGQERRMVRQIGEVVGHAIAAVERKKALMSDEVVELEFAIRNVFDVVGVEAGTDGTIALDETVPVTDDEFLVYGTVTDDAADAMNSLVEALPHWEAVTFRDGGFELRLTEPPILSSVASRGGSVERAVIEDGDYRMTLHIPPSAGVREIIETVQETYPAVELLTRRQTTRRDADGDVGNVLSEALTERQRAALRAAYHAGYFEWPRAASGEEVAESLDVSSPTFLQHLRKAEKTVFDSLLSPDS